LNLEIDAQYTESKRKAAPLKPDVIGALKAVIKIADGRKFNRRFVIVLSLTIT